MKIPRAEGTRPFTGPGPMAANVPGRPPEVVLKEGMLVHAPDGIAVPPCSVALYRFTL